LIIGVKYVFFSILIIYVHIFVSCNLQLLRSRLVELTRDLEELGVTQEQLKECVSPVDVKTMNQKVWLLWQGQGDLDHHLAVLCHQLEEKLGMRTMFDNR
jgi:nesprin-1